MTPPRLIAFSDRSVAPDAVMLERFEKAGHAALPGSVLFVLRDKELPARERLELGRELARRARASSQRFGVAERVDLARLLDADALHLGERDVATEDARRLFGSSAFVTRAVHDPDTAALLDADGVVLSPVLAPRKGRPAYGLGALLRARERLGPHGAALYALGGVSAENAAPCLAAGASGVAVIGALLAEPDPLPLLRALGIERH